MAVQLQSAQGQVFGPAGANHSQGLVPDPGASADSSSTHRFLRSDRTWNQVDYASITGTPSIPSLANTPQLLNTLTANNSATLSDTSTFGTAGYNIFELVFINILPQTASTTLELQVHSGGAFKSTGYLGSTLAVVSGTTGVANATTFIQCSRAATAQTGSGICGRIRAYKPEANVQPVVWEGDFAHADGTVYCRVITSGAWNTTAVVDGFQVLFSSGNIVSGSIEIYGIP